MKKSGLTIVLAILVLILLLLLGWCLWRCHMLPGSGCRANGEVKCEVVLKLAQPGVSVWPDGTVAIAAPIENEGLLAAGNVRVTAIKLDANPRIAPALPVALGELVYAQRAVVQTQFKPVAVPGVYTLTVSGTYEDRGATRTFTASWPIKLAAQATGPLKSVPVSVPVHHAGSKPLPPSPVHVPPIEINPVGPPTPLGPVLLPFPGVSPKGTPINPPGGSASSIVINTNTAGHYAINNVPPDPDGAVAPAANVVMQTDNSFLKVSTDGGSTFTQIDPTTIFPQTDGGLCCDQVTIYDKQHNLMFWLLQYASGGSPSKNLLRLAWATPEAIKANPNSAWSWVDLTQSLFNSGGGLDYPDLAISGSYIYVSVDGQDSAGVNNGLIVSRWSLSDIVGSGGTVNGAYFGVNESTDQEHAHGAHLAQNAVDGAYWGGNVDTSHLEVFHWPDSSGDISVHTTGINSWCSTGSSGAYTNLAPDGQQWPDTGHLGGDGNITGAVRTLGTGGGHGKVWLGWTAGRDASGCSQSGRPMPFVKIVEVDDQTLDSVDEYHIWNSPYAFGYVALASDPSGNVGVSVAYGGPSDYPSSTVGYLGDYVVYYVEQSNLSLRFYSSTEGYFTFDPTDPTLVKDSHGNPVISTRYGDYFTVRNAGTDGTQFTSQGYSVVAVDATQSTSCLTSPGCTFHTRYEVWGRPPVIIQ